MSKVGKQRAIENDDRKKVEEERRRARVENREDTDRERQKVKREREEERGGSDKTRGIITPFFDINSNPFVSGHTNVPYTIRSQLDRFRQ